MTRPKWLSVLKGSKIPAFIKTYELRLRHDNAIFVRPYVEVLGVNAVPSIRITRDDKIAPESIDVCLLEVHLRLLHHALSKDGVSTIASHGEVESDCFCSARKHYRYVARYIGIPFIGMFEYSDSALKVARNKLVVKVDGSVRFVLKCQ